jgi:NAD(P)H-hydrate repair Nnr-like enzyme with NAD(P)H-hydrate epimerase domain
MPLPSLSARAAAALDVELMQQPGFSLDQLVELAGLAVAVAFEDAYKPSSHGRVLALAGSGNNGLDALVAARHLRHFGFQPTVVYPKRPSRGDGPRLSANLVAQLESLGVPVLAEVPAGGLCSLRPQAILDGVFGFSFDPSGGVRAPFDAVLREMAALSEYTWSVSSDASPGAATTDAASAEGTTRRRGSGIPVVAIDVPSGWDVERGALSADDVCPSAVVHLTAPKRYATTLPPSVHEYLGGRFLPPQLAIKYELTGLPAYAGSSQVVKLR